MASMSSPSGTRAWHEGPAAAAAAVAAVQGPPAAPSTGAGACMLHPRRSPAVRSSWTPDAQYVPSRSDEHGCCKPPMPQGNRCEHCQPCRRLLHLQRWRRQLAARARAARWLERRQARQGRRWRRWRWWWWSGKPQHAGDWHAPHPHARANARWRNGRWGWQGCLPPE